MDALAKDLWRRAQEALRVARHDLSVSSDAAASRAYYGAFYAVSAWFAVKGRTFRKHSMVEAAVHRDLVRPGIWPKELGAGFSRLAEARSTADYGETEHVSDEEAREAIRMAADIVQPVSQADPERFPAPQD